MSAARRSIKRRDWPRGLYEARPGYYVWKHPDGRKFTIGRVPLAVARNEALLANQHLQEAKPGLVERLEDTAQRTISELLDVMPVSENKNTAKSDRSKDKVIREHLGSKLCHDLRTHHCATLLDSILDEGKERWAQSVRSRLIAVCKKGMNKGWMDANPAEATEDPRPDVKRERLSLEQFQSIYAKAPEVAEWLQHAMNLALVTGQDRSTIAGMARAMVSDGYLTVQRSKTKKTNRPVAIPLALRIDAVGLTLAELVSHRTGVISKYLVHHISPYGNAPAGSKVHPDRISHAFTEARKLAGIPDESPEGKSAPTFHEIRSLCKRLYKDQGGVDTKALLGHATEKMSQLYEDTRDLTPVYVKLG